MHPELLKLTVQACRDYMAAGDCHGEAPPSERLIAAVVQLREQLDAADEQIAQLVRALRSEVEPPIFMGEPVAPAGGTFADPERKRAWEEAGRRIQAEDEGLPSGVVVDGATASSSVPGIPMVLRRHHPSCAYAGLPDQPTNCSCPPIAGVPAAFAFCDDCTTRPVCQRQGKCIDGVGAVDGRKP